MGKKTNPNEILGKRKDLTPIKIQKIAKKFKGANAICELTGAKTYDRLVGYCEVAGSDFGRMMMDNSQCKVWRKYDVWDRY